MSFYREKRKKRCLAMNQRLLAMVFAVVAATVILLSVIHVFFLHQTSVETALHNYSEINRLTGNYLDEEIRNTEIGMNRMVFESNFQQALVEYEKQRQGEEQELWREHVREALASSLVISDLYGGIISNIIVFDTDGNYIASMRDYQKDARVGREEWKEQADALLGKSLWLPTHKDVNDTSLKHVPVISIAKTLYSTKLSTENPYYGRPIGYALMNIKETDFAQLYLDMSYGKTGKLYVVDDMGTILSAADKSLLGQKLEERFRGEKNQVTYRKNDGINYVLSDSENKSTGWTLAGTVEASELTHGTRNQWVNLVVIALAVFVLAVSIMSYASRQITRPLTELQGEMKKVENGNFDIHLPSGLNVAEVIDLYHGFQIMVKKLDELVGHVYESAKREQQLRLTVTEARLSILQNQMNPHFLYNTLDSIGWMAILNGNTDISQMVNHLGDILRASVKMDTFVSDVNTELQLLKKYAYIQKVRHGEKLRVQIEMEEDTKNCQILKFMLQPFVENAIVHGMKDTGEPMEILVRLARDGEELTAEIIDNGSGMDEEHRRSLFREKEGTVKSTGTGCYNVYRRLQLVYRDRFCCRVESRIAAGTRITIRIPSSAEKSLPN